TGKGMTIAQDYVAGTDPNDVNSTLRITAATFTSDGASGSLTWQSVPTRLYSIQKNPDLVPTNWTDSGLGLILPDSGAATTRLLADTNAPVRFYRVQAVVPLYP